jgi:hypothetical protein
MNEQPEHKSIYPSVSRGALSDNHEKYNHPVEAKGPKMGDMQNKVIIFGVVFFILFTLVFAFSMGLGRYFQK